jgi:hypothetical protein
MAPLAPEKGRRALEQHAELLRERAELRELLDRVMPGVGRAAGGAERASDAT